MSEMTNKQYVKFVKSLLKKNAIKDILVLKDHHNMIVCISNLCRAYNKLHRLTKNYVKDGSLGDARKLQEELEIDQWW